jgi:hypothetical protein
VKSGGAPGIALHELLKVIRQAFALDVATG